MKVAIIEPVGGHGGMNYYDLCLASGLQMAGVDIRLYTCDKTKIKPGLTFPVIKIFKNIWGDTPKINRGINFVISLLKALIDAKKNKVDLLHFHFFHFTKMEHITLSLSQLFGFKIIITVHDVESFIGNHNNGFAHKILIKADKIISHNQASKTELVKNIKLPESHIHIVPHGNYIEDIPYILNHEQARYKLQVSNDSPVILFFGQIKKVKGLDILLKALPELISIFPNLQLIIAGKVWKDNFKKYKSIINENQLENNILLHTHYIADEEVPIYYNAADIVVLPYTRIYQSGVLLMAMSYKKPVIVSDLEGMTEIIEDGINGLIFKTGNSESLSQKLVFALSDVERLNQIANSGYMTVLRKHSWVTIGETTASLYKDTML